MEARAYRLNESFEIDLEHLSTLVDRGSRFLFIENPLNPIGRMYSAKHIEEIFEFCRSKNLFILSDESSWN